jgi:hypothetical protein
MVLYRRVEHLVMDDAPWILQHHDVLDYLYQPYVQGVEINNLGKRAIPLKKVWLQKSGAEHHTGVVTTIKPSP